MAPCGTSALEGSPWLTTFAPLQLDAVVDSTNSSGFFAKAGPLRIFTGEKVRHCESSSSLLIFHEISRLI